MASRYLRKRLELLAEIFPPNPDSLLFPAPSAANADAKTSNHSAPHWAGTKLRRGGTTEIFCDDSERV